jgi:uncharacterized membrane protein
MIYLSLFLSNEYYMSNETSETFYTQLFLVLYVFSQAIFTKFYFQTQNSLSLSRSLQKRRNPMFLVKLHYVFGEWIFAAVQNIA